MAENHGWAAAALFLVGVTSCKSETRISASVCVDTLENRYAFDEPTPSGVSAAELFEHVSGEREFPASYVHDFRMAGMSFSMERSRGPVRWVHSRMETVDYYLSNGLPSSSVGGTARRLYVECLDHLQVPVEVHLTTEDGSVAFIGSGIVTTQRFSYPDDPEPSDVLAWLWADQYVDKVELFPPFPDDDVLYFSPRRIWVESRFFGDEGGGETVTEGAVGWSGEAAYPDSDGLSILWALYLKPLLEWDERE